ncbi:15791_t:CDS:2, partial [Dentiscutata heterogama]
SPSALKFGLKSDQKGVLTIPPVQNMENEYIFEIPLLKAGKSLKLEAALTLTDAEAFEHADFWVYLELGKITEPSTPKIVHILSFDVRVSTVYRGFPQGFYPDVLLVANHKITRNEYLAWVKLFKETLGLRFFIWDISQMGHFSLLRDITTLYSNKPTTLMKDLSGKTLIVLDNEFEYGEYGQKVTARNFILKNEWIEAIHKNDNKFYIFKPSARKDECVNVLDELLTNAFEEFRENKSEFENVRGFTQFLMGKEKDPLEEIPPDNTEENILEENHLEKNIPEDTVDFISTTINLRGIIAGLGIDNHFRILEMIFITGPLDDDEEINDIDLFLKGGHRTLSDKEKQVAELLKQQIIYDIAVELSTICDGI